MEQAIALADHSMTITDDAQPRCPHCGGPGKDVTTGGMPEWVCQAMCGQYYWPGHVTITPAQRNEIERSEGHSRANARRVRKAVGG
jgi:uncharacterized protein with PIN domain